MTFPWRHGVLPWWHSDEEPAHQCRRRRFDPWVGKSPWRRKWKPTPVFLPGKSHGQGAWRATVHGVTKSQTTTEHNQDAFLMHKILYNHSAHLLLYLYHLLARWPQSSHVHTAHSRVRSWLASIVFCLSAAITAASVPNGHRLDFREWLWSRPPGAPVSTDEGGVRERPSVVSDSDSQLLGGQREGMPCRLQWCRKAACGADETWARFQKSWRTLGGQEEGMWVTGQGAKARAPENQEG